MRGKGRKRRMGKERESEGASCLLVDPGPQWAVEHRVYYRNVFFNVPQTWQCKGCVTTATLENATSCSTITLVVNLMHSFRIV